MNIINRILGKYNRIRVRQQFIRNGNWIGKDTTLYHPENIQLGENTYINGGRFFASPNAKIIIGKNCLISYDVHMRTDMHNYKKKDSLILEQGHKEASIIIEDDCWIGYGAQIMAGVHIAKGCVIAAGAVLTKNTGEYEVWGGIPAKKIGIRE